MSVWYGRPEGVLVLANLFAFSYFGELLLRAARRRSVPMDRWLQTPYLRVDRLLGSSLCRCDFRVRLREHESQVPFTRHALSVYFRRREGPFSGGLQRQIRKEFAGSWRIELGSRYTAGLVNMDLDADAHLPMNGGARFRRHVR